MVYAFPIVFTLVCVLLTAVVVLLAYVYTTQAKTATGERPRVFRFVIFTVTCNSSTLSVRCASFFAHRLASRSSFSLDNILT